MVLPDFDSAWTAVQFRFVLGLVGPRRNDYIEIARVARCRQQAITQQVFPQCVMGVCPRTSISVAQVMILEF